MLLRRSTLHFTIGTKGDTVNIIFSVDVLDTVN